MSPPVALITGGSGYIGSALIQALMARGHEPIVAGRRSSLAEISLPSTQLRYLDLSTNVGFDRATAGIGTVVHCAGLAHNSGPASAYDTINTLATANLARAALWNGVRHFIFISSLNVVPPGVKDPCASTHGWALPPGQYARSKARAERALEDILRGTSCHLTVLRPALVYDLSLTANLSSLATLVSLLPVLLPPMGHRLMVSRPDLVQLIVNLVHRVPDPSVDNISFLIAADGQRYSARRIGQALSRGPVVDKVFMRVPLPIFIWRLLAVLRDRHVGTRCGTTWRSIAGNYWCPPDDIPIPSVRGWAPRDTFESVIQKKVGRANS